MPTNAPPVDTTRPSTDNKEEIADDKSKQDKKKKQLLGIAEDGSLFEVPALPDALETFIYPSQWNFSTVATPILSAITVYISLTSESVIWAYVLSVFWRLAYNAFLGHLLRIQSHGEGFTKFIQRLEANESTKKFLHARIGPAVAKSTLSVRSWVAFRLIATTVLDLDVVAFLCVVYRELMEFTEQDNCDVVDLFCIPSYIVWPVGLILIATSLYGKLSAHHTLGHYAWFWGDFFFRVSGSLVFDGIFELFPHPMYTAGYAWMYGFALIARSYALCALVLASHLCQMGFLSFVETPHIEKIYGKDEPATKDRERTRNFFNIRNFDIFRAGDLSTLFLAGSFVACSFVGVKWDPTVQTCSFSGTHRSPCVAHSVESSNELQALYHQHFNTCTMQGRQDYWCNTTDGDWGFCNCGSIGSIFFVLCALLWRVGSTVFVAGVLHFQAKSKFWTKHFESRGSTAQEAFKNWIQVQNVATSMSWISFISLAVYMCEWEFPFFSTYGTSTYCCCSNGCHVVISVVMRLVPGIFVVLVATCFMGISLWTFQECYNVLGDFGWYYGDFFLPNPRISQSEGLSYVGIYR